MYAVGVGVAVHRLQGRDRRVDRGIHADAYKKESQGKHN